MAENKGRKRLLFVDDEPSIRLTLPPILEKAGFEVHVAESVADALFEINSFQFDALNDRSLIVFASEPGRHDGRTWQEPGDAFIAAKHQKAAHRRHGLAAVIRRQQQMTFKYFGGGIIFGARFIERAAFKCAHETPQVRFVDIARARAQSRQAFVR